MHRSTKLILINSLVSSFIFGIFYFSFSYHKRFLKSGKFSGSESPMEMRLPFELLLEGPVSLKDDDPNLIQYIRERYLIPPSTKPYNMTTTKNDTSAIQASIINKLLGNMKGGFFVECGAFDGEYLSNSYFFERVLNWQGILIEADPNNFRKLETKQRKAYTMGACLSVDPYPSKILFWTHHVLGRITGKKIHQGPKKDLVEVQCFPFYSVMLAMNRTVIDYFSLDVEGHELQVLETVPFDKLKIRTLSVENAHVIEGKQALLKFMEGKGYVMREETGINGNFQAPDYMFALKEIP